MSNLSDYPQRLRASTANPEVVYTRVKGYYAQHDAGATLARSAVLKLDNGADTIAVIEGKPQEGDQKISAVYKSASGAFAVPTGQVFVRFNDDVSVKTQQDELRKLGYVSAESLSCAPNAAWLRHEKGDIASALDNIEALEKLSRVENVEPQLLSPRSFRQR